MFIRKFSALIIGLFLALPLALGCETCPSCPREKIYIPLIVSPSLPPVLIPLEKGEFDQSEAARGYPIYTEEDLMQLEREFPKPAEDSGDLEI